MSQGQSMSQNRKPSRTRSRSPTSRPTTPLRPVSRSSFRNSQANARSSPAALDALESQFSELADSMADLEANFMHLQLMHESLSRFNESFSSFLYGLNMNAFVVDFPEAPIRESIKRQQHRQGPQKSVSDSSTVLLNNNHGAAGGEETTLMAADASFASMKATPKRQTIGRSAATTTESAVKSKMNTPSARGGTTNRGLRGAGRAVRGSGLPRGRGRGGTTRG